MTLHLKSTRYVEEEKALVERHRVRVKTPEDSRRVVVLFPARFFYCDDEGDFGAGSSETSQSDRCLFTIFAPGVGLSTEMVTSLHASRRGRLAPLILGVPRP